MQLEGPSMFTASMFTAVASSVAEPPCHCNLEHNPTLLAAVHSAQCVRSDGGERTAL